MVDFLDFLIWAGCAAIAIVCHQLIFGEGLDMSSYFAGLLVAIAAIAIEENY